MINNLLLYKDIFNYWLIVLKMIENKDKNGKLKEMNRF